jgi:DNA processing protein
MSDNPDQNPQPSISSLDKAALFNHIKKNHLCSDQKLIKSLTNSFFETLQESRHQPGSKLKELCLDLKIKFSDIHFSKSELISFGKTHNIFYSCFGDKDYPSSFYHLNNPPAIFYYSGNLELINQNYNLSIVGTRNSSLYGEHCCRSVIESLVNYDVTYISGLARGIDLITHKTALRTRASSIAVIGSGLLAFNYYGEQKVYFEELKRNHLVISDFHPREHASRRSFAQRNRLIAALSNSTIVIEAPKDSGALITADYCLKLDRTLYAIPGDVNKISFEGGNKLLSENKALPIFQASKTPYVLGLDSFSSDSAFIRTDKKVDAIKTKVQKQILSSSSQKTNNKKTEKSLFKKTSDAGLANAKKRNSLDLNGHFEPEFNATDEALGKSFKDPLIDLLDSGINDFDLLLFKSHYQSQSELISHLTDLEIQGKISRRGALFVSRPLSKPKVS